MENLITNVSGRVRIKDRVDRVDITDESVFIRLDDRANPEFWFQIVLDRKQLTELLNSVSVPE